MFSKNYHLGYQGGSGGFILFHFLLLSEKYFSEFNSGIGNDIKKIVEHQWNVSDHKKWKNSEITPNNYLTYCSNNSCLTKLLFFCNPTVNDFFYYEYEFEKIKISYNNIKDSSWPDVNNLKNILDLPSYIKNELLLVDPIRFYFLTVYKNSIDFENHKPNYAFDKSIWIYTDAISQNELSYYKKAYWYCDYNINSTNPKMSELYLIKNETSVWKNMYVDTNALIFLNNSDIQIKLQEFINNPDILIDMGLIDKVSNSQLSLLNHWKKLHPKELLKKIGIYKK